MLRQHLEMDIEELKDIDTDGRDVRNQKDSHMNRRMDGILEVLRNGAELGIKEIAVNLPEYSEKMIQRELADLVTMGRVTKIGFKRWSKYVRVAADAPRQESLQSADQVTESAEQTA